MADRLITNHAGEFDPPRQTSNTMNQIEAIKLGQEWLEHAPPFDGTIVGPDAMTGTAGCVCRRCARRIIARGCDIKRIASTPLWDASPTDVCNICIESVLP